MTAPHEKAIREALPVQWKFGDEFAPYHHQASHCSPDYRDGWNHCYRAAEAKLAELRAEKDRLRTVLVNTRQALERANNGGAIQDTIWMHSSVSMAETLFDYIDAALAAKESEHG